MNFSIYNDERANIIILPHSKSGQITTYDKVYEENRQYCARLMEKGLKLENNVIIIDSIHSGVGILALESALKHCYPRIKISKYSINDDHHMTVDRKYNFRCQAIFSDYFPRIVNSYPARNFDDSTNFITNFINLDNPIAEMIIDIAKNYPYIKVEDTKWYQLNNIITTEIEAARTKYKIQQEKQKQYQLEKEESIRVEKETALASAKTFEPIITINKYGSEVYECPICKLQTVTSEVKKNNFAHAWNCPNQYRKIILPEPMMGESHPMLWESQPMDVWGSASPAMGGWESQPMDVWRSAAPAMGGDRWHQPRGMGSAAPTIGADSFSSGTIKKPITNNLNDRLKKREKDRMRKQRIYNHLEKGKSVLVLCQRKESLDDKHVKESVIPKLEYIIEDFLKITHAESVDIKYMVDLENPDNDKSDFNMILDKSDSNSHEFIKNHKDFYDLIVLQTCPDYMMELEFIYYILKLKGHILITKVDYNGEINILETSEYNDIIKKYTDFGFTLIKDDNFIVFQKNK
jgi:hypothetical protein